MICQNCRDAADALDGRPHNCADGPRVDGDGRWCDCQHLNIWAAGPGRAAAPPERTRT